MRFSSSTSWATVFGQGARSGQADRTELLSFRQRAPRQMQAVSVAAMSLLAAFALERISRGLLFLLALD